MESIDLDLKGLSFEDIIHSLKEKKKKLLKIKAEVDKGLSALELTLSAMQNRKPRTKVMVLPAKVHRSRLRYFLTRICFC